jgi:hypothetical protein
MSPDLKHSYATPLYPTPFEAGNQNQTTTWEACIPFYELLSARFPSVLRFFQIGVSDNGIPMHAGVVTADGVFRPESNCARAGRFSSTTTASIQESRKGSMPAWRWCGISAY